MGVVKVIPICVFTDVPSSVDAIATVSTLGPRRADATERAPMIRASAAIVAIISRSTRMKPDVTAGPRHGVRLPLSQIVHAYRHGLAVRECNVHVQDPASHIAVDALPHGE